MIIGDAVWGTRDFDEQAESCMHVRGWFTQVKLVTPETQTNGRQNQPRLATAL